MKPQDYSQKLSLVTHPKSIDSDLARKFKEASRKKASISDFITDFLCQFVSHDTKTAYVKDLVIFFDFLRSGDVAISHPDQIETFHFQLYRDHLLAKGYASATISRRLVAVRSFMNWCLSGNLISFNPLDRVKLPKVQTENETIAFDDDEVVKMILAPDLTSHSGRTHRLAIVLLFNLGLRRNELIHIRIRDMFLDRGHKVLRVFGKGEKTRLIPLNEFLQKEIDYYVLAITKGPAKVVLDADDFLLQTSDRGRKNTTPVNGSTIYRIINRYAKRLAINKRVSPHSCRATAISHLLDTKQRSIRDVATFAGHSNITTTERYDKRRGNLNNSAAYSVSYGDLD